MAGEKLSGFKRPKSYEFWEEELPRLPTGKIQRNLVKKRAMYAVVKTGGKQYRVSPGDILIGLPSNGLHTNGYSLARKIFFESEKYSVDTYIDSLKSTVGEALLKPHINYTNHVFKVLEKNIKIKGIAHITGGGLTENIPRILPANCSVKIKKDTWPKLELFSVLQNLGNVDENEMYRAFNMGIGMVFIVEKYSIKNIRDTLESITQVYEIGEVIEGKNLVFYD